MEAHNDTPLTTEEVEQVLHSTNSAEICETLVSLALYDADWKKVEAYCLELLEHPDAGVRAVAATCIGHLGRIHQQLDLELVLPALYRHQSDQGKWVAGNVDNALSIIERFMHVPVKRDPAMRGSIIEENNVEEIEEDEDEEEERPLSTEEIERALQSGDKLAIERTLVAMTFRNPDWRETQTYCLKYLEHPEASVRGVAAESISRLIYTQHNLDIKPAQEALARHQDDPSKYVAQKVKQALNDIQKFAQQQVKD